MQVKSFFYASPEVLRKFSVESAQTATTSSSNSGPHNPTAKYRTELCKFWRDYSYCPFGLECSFAHGALELRTKGPNARYRTSLCINFFNNMSCPYGGRCHFSHLVPRDSKLKVFFQTKPLSYVEILKEIGNVADLEAVEARLERVKPNILRALASSLDNLERS